MATPLPTAYLNGAFLPLAEARISPLDRGFLFADAVYEVIPVYDGQPFLLVPHLDRLGQSLGELQIRNPHDRTAWTAIVNGLIERNGGGTVAVYLQVTRGADSGRDHFFPDPKLAPTVFGMVTPVPDPHPDRHGIRAVTVPDLRWARCDIKTTGLLANAMARQAARGAGAGEALMLRDGVLTEASASSVLIVENGTVISRPDGREILPGTTIQMVLSVVRELGAATRFEVVSEARLRAADEIWVAAATRGVVAVTHLDGQPVGTGQPGPLWAQVAPIYEIRKRGG